jgi:protein-S-isoprenylcysteine O-methyltransferase Ste14
MKAFLAIRALFFVFLLPGMVAGFIPLSFVGGRRVQLPPLTSSSLAPWILIAVGAMVLLRCVWDFFSAGHGTLAPIDPPKKLVVQGLYRFTRNPMYNGVLSIVIGEAWLFHSRPILQYLAVVAVMFHLFVVFYEEPALRSAFGEEYERYRQRVPRWGFTLRPYDRTS